MLSFIVNQVNKNWRWHFQAVASFCFAIFNVGKTSSCQSTQHYLLRPLDY